MTKDLSIRLHRPLVGLLLAVAIFGCGGSKDQPPKPVLPTDPTPSAAAPVGLVVVAGDSGSAAVGTALATRPTVRAVDANGNGVANATVTFAVTSGGGTVSTGTQTTDAQGIASVAWTVGSTPGINALEVKLTAVNKLVTFTATAAAAAAAAPTQTVGPGGGVLTASLPNSGLGAIQITVPASAYASPTSFTVSAVDPGTAPKAVRPVARLRIVTSAGASDSTVLIRVPIRSDTNQFVSAYWFNDATQKLEPVAVVASDSTSVTVGISNFNWQGVGTAPSASPSAQLRSLSAYQFPSAAQTLYDLVFGIAFEAEMAQKVLLTTEYSPGNDDWNFVNLGSPLSPGGDCAGMTLSSLFYFDRLKSSTPLAKLLPPNGFPLIPALRGRDDPRGYRLAAVVQQMFIWDVESHKDIFLATRELSRDNWRRLMDAMDKTKQPQLIFLYNGKGGHVVVAYRISTTTGEIWVADPNKPGDRSVRVKYLRDKRIYEPFPAGLSADGPLDTYPTIRFIPRSSIKIFEDIGPLFSQLQQRTVGSGPPYPFPTFSLDVIRGSKLDVPLPVSGFVTYEDSLSVSAPSISQEVRLFSDDATEGKRVETRVWVPLRIGESKVGAAVYDQANDKKYYLIDFPIIPVTRKALVLADSTGTAFTAGSAIRFLSGAGRSFRLRMDGGGVPPDLPYDRVSISNVTAPAGSGITYLATTDNLGITLRFTTTQLGTFPVRFTVKYKSQVVGTYDATVVSLALADAGGSVLAPSDTLRFDSGIGRNFTIRAYDGATPPDLNYGNVTLSVSAPSNVSSTWSKGSSSLTLTLTSSDPAASVVRFTVGYNGQSIGTYVATLAQPGVVLTTPSPTMTGVRTTLYTSITNYNKLVCNIPWRAVATGSLQRVVIGEIYRQVTQSGSIDADVVTYPIVNQVPFSAGTFTGTTSWDWTYGTPLGQPLRFEPFTVEWAIRYKIVNTGEVVQTNPIRVSCQ